MNDPKQEHKTTAIYLPVATLEFLRTIADRRHKNAGGRGKSSVSKLIVDLIESRRKELQREL